MKKLILFLIIICGTTIVNAQQYTIKAHITGFKNGTKFYLEDTDVSSNIDSAVIQDDQFIMKGKLYNTPQSIWLTAQMDKQFHYTTLLMGNENITISGDVKDMPFDLAFTGSKTQDEHTGLTNLFKSNNKQRHILLDEYFALKNDSGKVKSKAIWKLIGKIDSTNNAINKNYIANHLNSYEALITLFYLKGSYPKDTLEKMYASLKPEYKQSTFGQRIGNYLKVGDILKKGDVMFDFDAIDKTGRKHRLADSKGKYILLDFSATYCGPCMQSLVDLENIHKNYSGKIDIVTYSGDGGKETWLKGVTRDKPTWLSLWDGQGNYGKPILKYGVSGFPTFFLIDPQGKIVGKWVGYDHDAGKKGSLETDIDNYLVKQNTLNTK